MIKIIKRYSVVSALILLCFFSAFLALCNGLLSTAKAADIIKTENQYAYTEEFKVSIRATKNITAEEILQIADSADNCNVYLDTTANSSMAVYFDEIAGIYSPDVVLKQNEPLSLPTSGSISVIPINGIVTSSGISVDELTVHGNKFCIIEKMDCEKYPFITNSFTLNGADYFAAFPNAIDNQKEIMLLILSNRSDVTETYSCIKDKTAQVLPDAIVSGYKTDFKAGVFQAAVTMENVVSVGRFLFALINTIIISYYWITVRRREIAIRKAFGASNLRVMGLVTIELLKLIGAAALLAAITQAVIWKIHGDEISFADSGIMAVGLLLAITAAITVAMIVPVRYILHIQPSEGVKL